MEFAAFESPLPFRTDPALDAWHRQLAALPSKNPSIREASATARDARRVWDLQLACPPITVRSLRHNAATIAKSLVLLAEIDDIHVGFSVSLPGPKGSDPLQLRGSYQVKDGTKNGVDRRVPLGERHIELLRRLPRTSEYILPNDKGGFQTQANVGRRLRRMMELAGIQNPERTNFTFHALRRTVATRIAESAGIEAAAFAIGDDPMVAKRHYVEKTTVQVPDYSHLLR